MSIQVSVPELFDQIGRWGFGYLLTVSDGDAPNTERPHLIALRPSVRGAGDDRVLRFDAGGGRACRNAALRPNVTIVFPPAHGAADGANGADGMSLVVDGEARVDDDHVDVRPTSAVLHRKAPPAP